MAVIDIPTAIARYEGRRGVQDLLNASPAPTSPSTSCPFVSATTARAPPPVTRRPSSSGSTPTPQRRPHLGQPQPARLSPRGWAIDHARPSGSTTRGPTGGRREPVRRPAVRHLGARARRRGGDLTAAHGTRVRCAHPEVLTEGSSHRCPTGGWSPPRDSMVRRRPHRLLRAPARPPEPCRRLVGSSDEPHPSSTSSSGASRASTAASASTSCRALLASAGSSAQPATSTPTAADPGSGPRPRRRVVLAGRRRRHLRRHQRWRPTAARHTGQTVRLAQCPAQHRHPALGCPRWDRRGPAG